MLYQFGITHIPRLGMQRSHLYDTSCQERQRHLLLAVTLARRETKCFAENFFLHPFKSSNTFTRCFSACKSSTKTAMREWHPYKLQRDSGIFQVLSLHLLSQGAKFYREQLFSLFRRTWLVNSFAAPKENVSLFLFELRVLFLFAFILMNIYIRRE